MKKLKNGFIKFFFEKRVTTVAAAWVYYFLTALLPLVFLVITAFGVFRVDLTTKLVGKLPEEFRQAADLILQTAKTASGGITVFFFITVLFSGSALLNQMMKDGEFFYGVKKENRGGLIRRFTSVIALGLIFCGFLAVALITAFGGKLLTFLGISSEDNVFLTILGFLFAILLIYAIIILLNKVISPVKLNFRNLVTGGFVALCIIILGSIAFMIYIRYFNNYNKFYGSLAAIIVFLLWSYIVMLGLATGAAYGMYEYKKETNS